MKFLLRALREDTVHVPIMPLCFAMPSYSSFNMQVDPVFEGLEGGPGTLIKYNPLSNVSSPEVWNFLRAMVMLSSFTAVSDAEPSA